MRNHAADILRRFEREVRAAALDAAAECIDADIAKRISDYEPIRGPGFVLVRNDGWGDTRGTSEGFVDLGGGGAGPPYRRPVADVLAALEAAGYLKAWVARMDGQS